MATRTQLKDAENMNDDTLAIAVNTELDKAEAIWNEVGHKFILEKAENSVRLGSEKVPSKIPGFPFLVNGQPKVQDFIAFVFDIRGSSKHLLNEISDKRSKVSRLPRVLYETTAVNAAGLLIIEHFNGKITEFLGDGYLALFKKEKNSDEAIYAAYHAARKVMHTLRSIVNPILAERYDLPELAAGIGLAFSPAIVSLVGAENNYHPKALGECVYRASKLSKGNNDIYIDKALKYLWPTSDNGTIQFSYINILDGAYKLSNK